MQIKECMTANPQTLSQDSSIRDAARLMAELDVGILPIEDNQRLIGTLTDRDIALRAVAEGKDPDTPVSEVMSNDIKYCYEDSEDAEVARNMAELQLRRLPVVNRDKDLVGIVSLGDLARAEPNKQVVGDALEGISRTAA